MVGAGAQAAAPVRADLAQPRHPAQPSDGGSHLRGGAEFDDDGVAPQFAFEVVSRTFDDHATAVDDGQPVREPVRFVEVVGREQHSRPLVGEPFDLRPHLSPGLRVEPGRRFVEEEHLRAVNQSDRDIQAPGHPAGVGPDQPVGGVSEAEPVEEFAGAGSRGPAAQSLDAGGEQQVLAAGGHRIAACLLRDQADLVAHLPGVADDIDAGHAGVARVRPRQSGQNLDRR